MHMVRRTKIVATLGPATRDRDAMSAVVEAGADVVRLNFAHDDPESHRAAAELARALGREAGKVIGVLVDLPGPKMRTGPIAGDETRLVAGRRFVLTDEDVEGDDARASTSVGSLSKMVSQGDEIYLADGTIILRVESVASSEVTTEIVRGGVLRSRKGMHLPSSEHHFQAFTEKDRHALELAVQMKADFVGLSFVRTPEDLLRARSALPKRGHRPQLVAKIETRGALGCLDEIAQEADAVMVARGDLGIQTPLEQVPLVQKQIIAVCNGRGIPVITATQMLESMTRSPLPTRAEVADVANAVLDGTDALMLSEETAVGDNAALAVETMTGIAVAAEVQVQGRVRPKTADLRDDRVSWAVAHAAVQAAEDLNVQAILCPTRSGSTPRRVAAFRPSMAVVGISSLADTLGTMALSWGVTPLPAEELPGAKDMRDEVDRAVRAAAAAQMVDPGALVAVVAGSPGPRAGRTDFVRVVRV